MCTQRMWKDTRLLYVAYLAAIIAYISWWEKGGQVEELMVRFQEGSLIGTLIFGLFATILGSIRVGSTLDKDDKRAIVVGVALLVLVAAFRHELNAYLHIGVLVVVSLYAIYHDNQKLRSAILRRNRVDMYTRSALLWGIDVPLFLSVALLGIFVGTQRLMLDISSRDVEIFISGALALELTFSNGVVAFVSEKARPSRGVRH